MQKSIKQQSIERQLRICKLRYLIHAIKSQDEDYIDNVTANNVNINDNYFNDGTPLHVAARIGNYQIFQKLIKIGADIHKRHSTTQETVLDSAMKSSNYDIVRYLNENGVKSSDCINGKTALQFATDEGTIEIMILLLLTKTTDISAKSDVEITPKYAGMTSHEYINVMFSLLIKQMLDLFCTCEGDGDTKTIFHAAADINNYTVLKNWLISYTSKLKLTKHINFFSYFTRTMCHHNDLLHHKIAKSDSVFQSFLDIKYGMDVIKRHIIESIAAGFYVSDRNIKAVCNAEIFDGYLAECFLEVEKMKNNVPEGSNITFIEILHKNVRYLAPYLKFVDLKNILNRERGFPEYPIYGTMLFFKLWKAQIRINYIKQSEEIINNIFYQLQLPYTFIRELYFCLSNDDLQEIVQPSR